MSDLARRARVDEALGRSLGRKTRTQEIATARGLLQRIESDRMAEASPAIAAARELVRVLRDELWAPFFGFDARRASPALMSRVRSTPSMLEELRKPWSIAPDFGA